MSNAKNIAATIQQQIGHRAFVMMGAKNLSYDAEGSLSFRIGRNSKKVNHVKVALAPDDTYTVTFTYIGRAPSFKIEERAKVPGVYVDSLHTILEAHTGLYTSL